MDKIDVEVRGATGIVKIPLSKFVYHSENKEDKPLPEDDKGKKKPEQSNVPAFTIAAISILVILILTISYYLYRRAKAKEYLSVSQTELDSIDNSGHDTLKGSMTDEASVHLKKD